MFPPPQLKQGILTPAGLIEAEACKGMVLQRINQNCIRDQIELRQSKMHRWFTSNSSAVNAALIEPETQNEAKELGEPLKQVTFNAYKAFDVFWQETLLC